MAIGSAPAGVKLSSALEPSEIRTSSSLPSGTVTGASEAPTSVRKIGARPV